MNCVISVVDSKRIKSEYEGQYRTVLKLADPEEGTVWLSNIYKKQLKELGLIVLQSLNVNSRWYFRVSISELEKKGLI